MEYFSVRNGIKIILVEEFYYRVAAMMEDFAERDYFKEKLKVFIKSSDTDYINKKSRSHIGFNIYPFKEWGIKFKELHSVFDAVEFLYRFVSKPGEIGYVSDHTGWNTEDYLCYDDAEGKKEFIEEFNLILKAYDQGYELQLDGTILFLGDDSVNFINSDFPEYDEQNIDDVIRLAIKWWKNKNQTLEGKKQAILKLTGVLEYLKQDKTLAKVLGKEDTKDLFNIANNFGLRHHNLEQKLDYDKDIWYDWIFQYYLNTCIGILKLIKKQPKIPQ